MNEMKVINKEQQVKEIAKLIFQAWENCKTTNCCDCKYKNTKEKDLFCSYFAQAEAVYNAFAQTEEKPKERLVANITIDENGVKKITDDKENSMQIFYDIERTLSQILKDLNEAKQGMMFDTLAYVNAKIAMAEVIQCFITELKTKYTGEPK